MTSSGPQYSSAQRGVALLVVLVLLAILVPVITLLSFSTKTELDVSRSYRGRLQNRAGIDTAVTLGRVYLTMDARQQSRGSSDTGRFDAPSEQWATPFGPKSIGGADVSFRIEDEARRVNLNWIVTSEGEVSEEDPYYQQGKRLFDALELQPQLFEQLVEHLKSAPREADSDDVQRRYLHAPGELKRVDGFTEELLYGHNERPPLLRYVTTWPVERPGADENEDEDGDGDEDDNEEDARDEGEIDEQDEREQQDDQTGDGEDLADRGFVNLNTAPRPVLLSLLPPGEQRETVVDLITARRGSGEKAKTDGYFRSREDVLNLASEGPGARDLLREMVDRSRFSARIFSVFIRSRSDGVTETVRVVMKRSPAGSGASSPEILWFNRGVSLEVYDVLQDQRRATSSDRGLLPTSIGSSSR